MTNKSSTKRLGLVVFFAFNITLFTSLGIWQVNRLAWKADLIERVEARVHAVPQTAPLPAQWDGLSIDNSEYSAVQLNGQWIDGKEVTVYANTDLGPGYWVMAPMQVQADHSAQPAHAVIWVNQGFVPTALRQAPRPSAAAQGANVQVTGLLRWPEKDNLFLRENVPAEERWYRRWPHELSQARGLTQATAPYFIDAFASPAVAAGAEEWPRGGMTQIQFRNNHLSYAITWFILALLNVAALAYVLLFDKKRSASVKADD